MKCPKCNSEKIERLKRGTKTGGAVGFTAGATGAIIGTTAGATGLVKGLTAGATLGSAVPGLGTLVGGIMGALAGGATGIVVGATAGKALDSCVLDNRKCHACGHEWNED